MHKSKKLPLRDERVVAIYPAGADASFDKKDAEDEEGALVLARGGNGSEEDGSACFSDVSSRTGTSISQLCFVPSCDDARLVRLDTEGPYSGVGAWRITAGRFEADVPLQQLLSDGGGLTVSFWARGMDVGTVLFDLKMASSKEDITGTSSSFSAVVIETEQSKQVVELRSDSDQTSLLEIDKRGCNMPMDEKWLWISSS